MSSAHGGLALGVGRCGAARLGSAIVATSPAAKKSTRTRARRDRTSAHAALALHVGHVAHSAHSDGCKLVLILDVLAM